MSNHRAVVAIIDYQMGNMFSVANACSFVGLEPVITSDKDEILKTDAALLPGVGAFGEAMANLNRLDLVGAIHTFIDSGRPFMGICLGMQLLFESSEEFGFAKGLGIIPGRVIRFPNKDSLGNLIRTPHMGWNKIYPHSITDFWMHSPLEGLPAGSFMYFVHSYFCEPRGNESIACCTKYESVEFCSAVRMKNVFATQFHPEKSGPTGIEIYRNFRTLVV